MKDKPPGETVENLPGGWSMTEPFPANLLSRSDVFAV